MTRYLIRGAYLLTMEGDAPETLAVGDVAIDGDRIAGVGSGLDGADAEVIDGRGMIAMPGLVDTHRHMWAAMLRGGACYGTLADYFGTVVFTYGAAFTPDDTYRSVRFGLAESVDGGITTIHAWEHNLQTPDHARAAVQALRESGMRGRFSYGSSSDPTAGSSFAKGDETLDLDDILRLRDEEFADPAGRLHLGIAARGHEFSREHIWKQEFAWAREHGLPITAHCMMTEHDLENGRAVGIYEREGALGPDLLLVHCIRVDEDEIGYLARTRTPVSISILSNLRCGMGLPPVLAMMRGGVEVSLSLDTMAAADCADMFNAMRITMGIERAKADDGSVYQPREALAQATTKAAATLGLGDITGALRPGLKADVVLLRATDLNMAPLNVLDGQVVLSAQPQNVDTVFIDGVLRKRHGELIGLDRRALVEDVSEAMKELNARVGAPLRG
jgi:cytosine/adenosine deaminase-related metal-dependent hydrolase